VMLEKDGEDQWTYSLKNDEVLHRAKEERNSRHTTKEERLT
jgi:hypothetical protein